MPQRHGMEANEKQPGPALRFFGLCQYNCNGAIFWIELRQAVSGTDDWTGNYRQRRNSSAAGRNTADSEGQYVFLFFV